MRQWKLYLVIVVTILLVGLAAGWWLLTPKVVSIYPPDGAVDIQPVNTIQITFSGPMNRDKTQAAFQVSPANPGTFTWLDNTLIFSPESPWEDGQTISVKIGQGAVSSIGLPLSTGKSWSFSTRHAWLLYLFDIGSQTDLYRIDAQGYTTAKVIDTDERILDFTINSDGTHIVYSKTLNNGSEIHWYDLVTKSDSIVYASEDLVFTQLALSPDAKYLSFTTGFAPVEGGTSESRVWVLPLNQKKPLGEPQLASGNDHPTRDPAWSSLGWLAYYDAQELQEVFYLPGTGERKKLLNETGEPGTWNPGGTQYLYSEIIYPQQVLSINPEYYSQLVSYNPETETKDVLTQNDQVEDLLPVFSPDGNKVAFARRFLTPQTWTPGRQLWTINVNGSNPQQLTNSGNYNHLDFAWSPDGTLIAYNRFNTASFDSERELWIINAKSGITQKVLVGAYRLEWLP